MIFLESTNKKIINLSDVFKLNYIGGFLDNTPFRLNNCNISTKYIKIIIPNRKEFLHFDQIKLISKNINIAPKGHTSYSSTWNRYNPNKSNHETKKFANGKIGFHTSKENNAWWKIEFENIINIDSIEIFNRIDKYGKRLEDFKILISYDDINYNVYFDQTIQTSNKKLILLLTKIKYITSDIVTKIKNHEENRLCGHEDISNIIYAFSTLIYVLENNIKGSNKIDKSTQDIFISYLKDLLNISFKYAPRSLEFGGIKNNKPLRVKLNNLKTNKIKIYLDDYQYLHLDKIELLNKLKQSIGSTCNLTLSSHYSDKINPIKVLLPGNANGGVNCHTKLELNPYIIVTLQDPAEISEIRLYNRCDKYAWRNNKLKIDASINDNWKTVYCNLSQINSIYNAYNFLYRYLNNDINYLSKLIVLNIKIRGSHLLKAWYILNDCVKIDRNKSLSIHKLITTESSTDFYSPKLTATNHAISEGFINSKVDIITKSIHDLTTLLKIEFKIDVFIAYGTLLGAIRNKKLISHDDDIDLIYISNKSSRKEIFLERERIAKFLENKNYRVWRHSGNFHVRKQNEASSALDIFPSWVVNNKWSVYPFIIESIDIKEILPIKQVELEGYLLPSLNNTELFLKSIYGDKWRIPDPLFRHNFKNYDYFKFLKRYDLFIDRY